MAVAPANIKYGTITLGTILIGKDGADAGRVPDATTLNGLATFTPMLDPSYEYLIDASAGKLVFLDPVTCDVLNGELVDSQGVAGIQLVSNLNTALNPPGWNWELRLEIPDKAIGPMYFDVEPDVTTDLSQIAVVPSGSRGIGVVRGESAYELAVDNGFVGTVEEWLASLQGTDGSGGPTNLAIQSRDTISVTLKANEGGQLAVLPRATTALAGVMAAADKTSLNASIPVATQFASSQSAMLALTTKLGDFVKRTDTNLWYRRNAGTAGTMADFDVLPSGAVDSVNGQVGAVTVTAASVGLGSVNNTSDSAKPVSTAQQAALDLKANTASLAPVATAGTYQSLTGTPPNLVLTNPFPVASQAAMLALSGAGVGDIAIRSDVSKNFVLSALPASTLANWLELVGGSAPPVDPAPGTGGSRTLGTGANQAAAGNDGRLFDARDPKPNSVVAASIPLNTIPGSRMLDDSIGSAKINDAAVTVPKLNITTGTGGTGKYLKWISSTALGWDTPAGGAGSVDLARTLAATQVTITPSGGGAPVVIPATDATNAGVFTVAQRADLLAAFKGTVSADGATFLAASGIPAMRTAIGAGQPAYVGTLAAATALSPTVNNGRFAVITDMGNALYRWNGTTLVLATDGPDQSPGVEVAYSRLPASQTITQTTWTDVGLTNTISTSIAIGYDVELIGELVVNANTNFATSSTLVVDLRIVSSDLVDVGRARPFSFIGRGTASQTLEQRGCDFKERVPANHPATTWKVQAKLNNAGITGIVSVNLVGAAAQFPTAGTGRDPVPSYLACTTVVRA
jgi:hypothetical protein